MLGSLQGPGQFTSSHYAMGCPLSLSCRAALQWCCGQEVLKRNPEDEGTDRHLWSLGEQSEFENLK